MPENELKSGYSRTWFGNRENVQGQEPVRQPHTVTVHELGGLKRGIYHERHEGHEKNRG